MYIGPRLAAMMFLEFFIWGAWYVTVGNFISAVGWDAGVIGWAYTVGPLAGIISPFFLGMVADRFFSAERVLATLHVLGGLAMFGVPFVATGDTTPPSGPFVGLLLLHMLFYMPTLGLVNTLAFHNMTDQEKQFPLIRVFGTIGWIVAGLLVSGLLDADKSDWQFWVAGGASIALGIYSLTLPHTPPQSAGKQVALRDVLCLDALALLKDPSFAVFMICSFLICIPLAAYYAFAPPYVDGMGIDNPGVKMSFGQMSEVFFMLVMPLFFRRLGVKWMLAVGMLAWVVRYGLFAYGADDGVFWMIMGGILLHGICYDFFFVTGQIYVDKRAPRAIRGQAQGFLVLMTLGLGLLIGAKISGMLVGAYTPPEAVALQERAREIGGEIFQLEKQLGALTDEASAEAQALRAQAAGLVETKQAVSREANSLVDWKVVWTYPAVAAGAILLIFCLIFRERAERGPVEVDEAAAAAAAGTDPTPPEA